MRPTVRHDEIVRLVQELGEASVDDLAERLDVSRETIRRDLVKLEGSGKLKKFHGGARALESQDNQEGEGSFAQRIRQNPEGKRAVAQAAAMLVGTDETLLIDAGTTTLALCEALVRAKPATIITNSIRNAEVLSRNPAHRLFVVGGEYHADAGENLGPLVLDQLSRFRARLAILTVAAIDAEGAMDFDLQEAEVAKAMIARADEVMIVADHTKFGKRAVFDVARMPALSTIVTDKAPPEAIADAMKSHGVKLMVADSAPA